MPFPVRRLPILTTRWHATPLILPSSPRRCYSQTPSDKSSKLHLPGDKELWSKQFKIAAAVNHRISVRKPETAAIIADAFVPEGSKDKIIVEAYPGPGQLTRALLALPKERIKRLIVLENWQPYLEWLKPLQDMDPRIEIIRSDPFLWDTYSHITESGILNEVQKVEWNKGVHPQLQFISHLPSTVYSEQLLSQFLRSMPEHNWLFSYGRFPLNFIMSQHLYRRVVATIEDRSARCKLSIIAEASAQCTSSLDFAMTDPYEEHFYPLPSARSLNSADVMKDSRSIGRPFRTMTIIPSEHQLIVKGQMDAWDFVLRRLYVKKSTALKDAIHILAPNSRVLIGAVTDPNLPEAERLDVTKRIRDMEARDWAILLKAFDEWPFRPADLTFQEGFSSSLRSL